MRLTLRTERSLTHNIYFLPLGTENQAYIQLKINADTTLCRNCFQ